MRIEILGTRGHMEHTAPGHMLYSGVMIDEVLFDLGDHSFLERRPCAIFLTHLHSDHAFFTEGNHARLPAPVFAPQGWKEHPEIQVIRTTREVGGLTITPVPTVHSTSYRSCAYLVEDGVNRMMYTGDLVSIQRKYRDRLPEMDLVITDGSFIREGGLVHRDERGRPHGHTGIPDLVRFFSPLSPRILFTHFGSWFFRNVEEAIQTIEGLGDTSSVEVAREGMVIKL